MATRVAYGLGHANFPVFLDQLPEKVDAWGKRGGYLYALEFSNGVVKLGRATDPADRIVEHCRVAYCGLYTLNRGWVSDGHEDCVPIERIWKGWAAEHAAEVRGFEYFLGLDFDAAVSKARTFNYTQVATAPPWGAAPAALSEKTATTSAGCGHCRPQPVLLPNASLATAPVDISKYNWAVFASAANQSGRAVGFPSVFGVREAAKMLGVSSQAVIRLVHERGLAPLMGTDGRSFRFRYIDVYKFWYVRPSEFPNCTLPMVEMQEVC